jgi:hypothetical protein
MSALTSLLVRDRVVPVSKIEEALQSQVFLGGDIEIILLEMNVVPEDVLSAYRAALFDLLPATRDEVMRASREALRRVPRDLARSLGIVPMHYDGGTLVVAAWEPLSEARTSEVEAQLDCELSVRIVNQARLASGLAHHYGFELDPRLRRLSDTLRRRDPGVVPFVRPPTPSPRSPVARGSEPEDASEPEDDPSAAVHARSAIAEAYSEVEAEVTSDVPAVSDEPATPLEQPVVAAADVHQEGPFDPTVEPIDARIEEPAPPAQPGVEPEPSRAEPLPPGVSPELAHVIVEPIDVDGAADLLRHAAQRDDVLYVLMRYLQQYFDFVGIFSVSKEGARARMAFGLPLSREAVEQAFIPAGAPGLLQQLSLEKQPIVGYLGGSDEELYVAELLGRSPERPVLLVPVTLNGRLVLALMLEQVGRELTTDDVALVQPLLPAAGDALRRIILQAKRRASVPPPALPPSLPEALPVEPPVAVEPAAPQEEEPTFSAVDLDTFERLARNEAGWQLVPPRAKQAPAEPERQTVERLQGVPRAAPPPPLLDVPAAVPRVANGYRARAAGGGEPPVARVEPPRPSDDGARRSRLSLVEPTTDVPSVIIDMGESVETLIELLLQAPPGSEPAQVQELLAIGEPVLPVLIQRFPGPLWFDRNKPFKRRPRGRDISAVAYTIVAFGEPAAPYLASVIGGSDPDRCYYALMVAGEVPHNDLIDPVARRVLDRDDAVRLLALEVLRGYAALPQYDVVMRAIAELSERPGKDPRRQRLAVEALGELRDQRALRTLIARLSDRDEQVVQAAHRALVVLTGQDFGISPRKWESWAEGWGRAHRVEWLIESLLHNDESVRALAGDELKQLTQQYFGYHPALPRRDRELAQRKYREWWELEGRLAMFASGLAR